MVHKSRIAALLLVIVASAAVAYYRTPEASAPGVDVTPPAAVQATSGRSPNAAPQSAVPDVKVDDLKNDRPGPVVQGRNPFRLAPPPTPVQMPAGARPAPVPNATPAAQLPPPVPPIPLKFIGIVSLSEGKGKVAVLSDGRFVHHGREGEIIDGRYRIVRIGEESIELEYADGRGRQTLRLSGS